MASNVLTSFQYRGITQALRYMLEYAEEDYMEMYQKYDISNIESSRPHGDLPTYRDNDILLMDYYDILTHIAVKFNLVAKNDYERQRTTRADEISDQLRTMWDSLVYASRDTLDERLQNYLTEVKPHLQLLSVFFFEGESWFAGERITYVDFIIFELLEVNEALYVECLHEFEKLRDFKKRFLSIQLIDKYRQTERFIRRPLNAPIACYGEI